jgi:hypothetical protein
MMASKNCRNSAHLVNEMAREIKAKQALNPPETKRTGTDRRRNSIDCSDLTHGMPTHFEVSMKDLVQNKFGNEGERATSRKYSHYIEQRRKQGQEHMIVKETRCSIRRAESLNANRTRIVKEPFKLTRFKNVIARTKTRWFPVEQPSTEIVSN